MSSKPPRSKPARGRSSRPAAAARTKPPIDGTAGRPTAPAPSRSAAASASGSTESFPFETTTAEFDALPNLYAEEAERTNTDQTAVLAPTSLRSAQRATLMVLSGTSAGKVFPLVRDHAVVGRGKEADLALSDPGISRIHCEIFRDEDGRFLIQDQQSTNGTLVNGAKVIGRELRPGDRIQIGSEVVLQFGYFDAAEESLANELYESATRDPLTRALNRRSFEERLLAEVSYAVRHKEKLVALLLDIDRFKSINDTHGHAAGDEVLRGVAQAIAATHRTEDVFARYGGEEFVLLGRGLKLANGIKLAERIRSLIERTDFSAAAPGMPVTVSIGVAELKETPDDADGSELLMLADRRLYAAKAAGRNRVVAK
jgi:diguanylate cyclase (GGDEF)-like protein